MQSGAPPVLVAFSNQQWLLIRSETQIVTNIGYYFGLLVSNGTLRERLFGSSEPSRFMSTLLPRQLEAKRIRRLVLGSDQVQGLL